MITEKDIIKAYIRIRTIDNTIPDELLDFIKDASIKQLRIGSASCSCADKEKQAYQKGWNDGASSAADDISVRI